LYLFDFPSSFQDFGLEETQVAWVGALGRYLAVSATMRKTATLSAITGFAARVVGVITQLPSTMHADYQLLRKLLDSFQSVLSSNGIARALEFTDRLHAVERESMKWTKKESLLSGLVASDPDHVAATELHAKILSCEEVGAPEACIDKGGLWGRFLEVKALCIQVNNLVTTGAVDCLSRHLIDSKLSDRCGGGSDGNVWRADSPEATVDELVKLYQSTLGKHFDITSLIEDVGKAEHLYLCVKDVHENFQTPLSPEFQSMADRILFTSRATQYEGLVIMELMDLKDAKKSAGARASLSAYLGVLSKAEWKSYFSETLLDELQSVTTLKKTKRR
jgi:hypothetical protein